MTPDVGPAAPPAGFVEIPPPPSGVSTGKDHVRKRVMCITIGIFALTVLFALIAGMWFDKPNTDRVLARSTPDDRRLARELEEAPFDHLKQLLQILLPAETALLGSATGFYFGASEKQA